jgi:hypothetical protein
MIQPPRDMRVSQGNVLDLPVAHPFLEPATPGDLALHVLRVVFIEITNACGLLCEIFQRTFVSYEKAQTNLPRQRLRIVEQFPHMQRAVLHGIGEPLIDQGLARMIEYLKARVVTVLFNPNATPLTDKSARQLLAFRLDEMRSSIDSATPAMYAQIRGAPLLHRIGANLKRFTDLQRELGQETPRASIWMAGMRASVHELSALVRLA